MAQADSILFLLSIAITGGCAAEEGQTMGPAPTGAGPTGSGLGSTSAATPSASGTGTEDDSDDDAADTESSGMPTSSSGNDSVSETMTATSPGTMSSSGTGGSLDPAEVCAVYGANAFDCFAGEYGYDADDYAENCVSEITYYADCGEACGELLTEDYACVSELSCRELMLDAGPCQHLSDQFAEECVGSCFLQAGLPLSSVLDV